jgi:hypothetical protein
MIITMIAMRVMQMTLYEIIGMVAVWHGLVAATRSVFVIRIVLAATMVRAAAIGIRGAHRNGMLVDMIVMRVMQMAVVEIIGVAVVANRNVAAALSVCMRMIGVNAIVVRSHGFSFRDASPGFQCDA